MLIWYPGVGRVVSFGSQHQHLADDHNRAVARRRVWDSNRSFRGSGSGANQYGLSHTAASLQRVWTGWRRWEWVVGTGRRLIRLGLICRLDDEGIEEVIMAFNEVSHYYREG